ncbi:hypothetical protein VTL71DRAFT_12664 [Oculimacula yallundae]|uniref:Uncharacterized protein n=1 Tax=Oculimacula yallundae TaxID=86028 RepID=A0ABR4CNP3_9HELO
MGQEDDRRAPEKGRGHKTPGNNENKREKITPKGQPARVVLKSNPSASKITPRITLRATQKTTPKSPWTMRETPPSKKETSSATRHTISSQRSTPASNTKDSSPAMGKVTLRAGTSRSTRERQTTSRQQGSTKTPPSANHLDQRSSKKELFDMIRDGSNSSISDPDVGLMLRPRLVSLRADAFKDLNSTEVSSDGELDNDNQIGGSPFYADEELSGDDLESRMRSFLKRRERSRISRRSEIKAVKWDPAIVTCGPLSSITNNAKAIETPSAVSPRERQHDEPTKDLKYSLDNLHEIAADLKKADKRILQQLLEALKSADSSDDTTIIRPKKRRVPLGEQKNEVKGSHTVTDRTVESQQNKIAASVVKGLNPEAPVYRNFAIVKDRFSPQKENKENIPQGSRWPLNVQRKRPHSIEDGHNVTQGFYNPAKPTKYIPPALRTRKASPTFPRQGIEPIWVKKDSFPSKTSSLASDLGDFHSPAEPYESLIDAPLDQLYSLQPPLLAQVPQVPLTNQPILPPSWMTGFPTVFQPLLSQSAFQPGLYEAYSGYGFQPNAFSNPTMAPEWYSTPMIPLSTMPLPNKSTKNRTKRTPGNVIPSETGPGRESVALEPAWSTQLLDNFMAKYPKTGTKKPLPKLTKEKKIATHIQQKLEVLLYHQKEKQAMEQRLGVMPMMGLPRMVSNGSLGSTLSDSLDASVMS